MATGKRYYWIKLRESFMGSDEVDYLMSRPNGANYIVLYQMLCLKTINSEGKLSCQMGEILMPFDIEKIQRDCKWFSIDTIRVALNLYRSLGWIYEDQNGILVLDDYQNLVGSETDYAAQKKVQRQNQQRQISPPSVDEGVDIVHDTVHTENRDKILDIRDKDFRDEEREIEGEDIAVPQAETAPPPSRLPPCPFKKIMDLYHQICVSYPRIEDIDGERKKAVAARWRKYGDLAVFEQVFRIAQASSFMKGENGRNWSADFDWMMRPTNISKILEHKYDDKPTAQTGQPTGALGVLARMREECDE
ncbi:MAG: phage replisome organizer N-terminal domain-containing protein [Clostridia bacterium]|nr:phage replisome organizer N-terminal domain-containing protein [Clostridia bacterium]